jgi:hypothetical protein
MMIQSRRLSSLVVLIALGIFTFPETLNAQAPAGKRGFVQID